MNNVNHIVVCGYDQTTNLLLDMLAREFDTEQTRVVVFDNYERPRDVSSSFLWVQGDPTKESELDKVRLTHARAAVVVGSRELAPQTADARTILNTFTIRAYLRSRADEIRGRRRPLYVVAEILDAENVHHARTAGADEVLETRRLGFSMMAHTIRFHGTADTMGRVLMSGAHNAYVGVIPDPPSEGMAFGELLARTRLIERGGIVIGLRLPTGDEVFDPDRSYLVAPGTHVVYLAEEPLLEPPE